MAAHAITPPPHRRWPARVAALVATAALLGCGVAIAVMVIPSSEDEVAAPAARPAAEQPAAAEAPAKPSLTPAQRADRRAAVAALAEEGFKPVRLADWRAGAQLRVLVGRHEEGGNRAFFFVGSDLVGSDDPLVSGKVRVTAARKRSVTLAYGLYEAGDEPCCPGGGEVEVSFRWQDGAVVPDTAVPPLAERRATS
jgi:LppP/LprE lipoprotein